MRYEVANLLASVEVPFLWESQLGDRHKKVLRTIASPSQLALKNPFS